QAAQGLAVHGPRDRVDHVRRARQLGSAELRASERAQLLDRRGPRAGAGYDERHHDLAPFVVGNTDHAYVVDVGMMPEHGLDLGGTHVDAAGDDQILQPVDYCDAPGGVDGTDVARVEPTVAVDRVRGAGRVEPVRAHHHRAAYEDLTVAREPHLGAGDRYSVEREAAPRLREPVRIDDAHSFTFGAGP